METLRKAYLLVLSAWIVCAGSAEPNDPAWNDPTDDSTGKPLVIPFSASIAVTIVVLTILLTITFLLIVYVKYRRVALNRRRRRSGFVHRSPARARPVLSAGILPANDSGVERSVIDALPVFRFASLQGLKEGLECVVCLSIFEDSEFLRLLPKCQHAFHVGCVDTWLECNSTCPLCRQKVEAEDVLMVYRREDAEEAAKLGLDDRAPQLLQAFVQRENVDSTGRESESSRFTVAGSFRQASGLSEAVGSIGCFGSGRKEGLLLSETDEESEKLQFDRRFAHRIVLSDVMFQHRWSDIRHSDLLFLNSQMITTDSGHIAFANIKPPEKMEMEFKTTETKKVGAQIGSKRSMSEIVGFHRFHSRSRNNNTLLPVSKCTGKEDEQKWFSIAEKTVQWSTSNGNGKWTMAQAAE